MAVNPALAGNLSTAALLGGGSGMVPPGPIPEAVPAPIVPPVAAPAPMPAQNFQDRNLAAAQLLQGGQQEPELPPEHSLEGPQPDGTFLVVRKTPDGASTVVKVISVPAPKARK